ncbi:PREDICTED: epidermis-specific secreted glycoprotein EP1-like [Tarenaya hassleriana]|uniref:epidermis-specific secreted glycoprotein EP1-like n=1 Tax=Tarenaya hassleriana TaxID=28532 RepID=UPI00053C20AD|nr:PREDICTED: epidermis-specific secreted glycoprotein EP1-like [Tarenaya hassleriana]
MSPLHIFVTLAAVISATLAQVPPDKTFTFVNEGEFGEYIIEYDASYRWIETPTQSFSSRPFRLCFYNTTPSAYVFAIRAGLPNDESLMRWVWDANRNSPVGDNSTLSLGRDGNLVLAEADGRVKWQTNTANKGVTGMRMLPTGNLVLHDKNGKFVWQSFDHPTDTLLVGQSLKVGGVNKLVSRKSDLDGSDGPYSMVLDSTGLTMYINKTGTPLVYGGWTNRDWRGSATFEVQPENDNSTLPVAYELILTPGPHPPTPSPTNEHGRRLLQVRPIGNGFGTVNLNKVNYNATTSFLRLGSDGTLKAYTYFDNVRYLKWEETFSFFSTYFVRRCGLPSLCGDYGYCDNGMCVACPTSRGLLGWSEDCKAPKATQFCGSKGRKVNYYKIVGVEHFLGPYVDEGEGPMAVGKCKERCDRDCKCLGYFYKEKTRKCLLAPLLATLIKDVNTSVGYIKY